jgi:ABC-type Mn2+/Zn2+ transport system ATPase subunit
VSGQIVGLLGPNGCGKSTLLKAIVGLVPRLRGEIRLDEAPLDRASLARVAYVPQRNEVDWSFPITVEEVVLLGRQGRLGLFGRPGPADRRAASEALERLGMDGARRAQIGELSGGQQQRVFLARALAQQGEVLLLDEPLTGVDTTTQEVVLQLLADLRRAGQVIVMATHDLAQAAETCDRLCLLNGRVVAFGPPAEALTAEHLAATYGGGGVLRLPGADGALVIALPHGAGAVCLDDGHLSSGSPAARPALSSARRRTRR